MPSTFTARYATTCIRCGLAINPGDQITWNRRGEKGSSHAGCVITEAPPIRGRVERATQTRTSRSVYRVVIEVAVEKEVTA